MEHPWINAVAHFLLFTSVGQAILILSGFFDFMCVVLVLTRRTTKHLVEDLGLARHILVVWFLAPIFRIYFWFLEGAGKLVITVNSPIPWEEKCLEFVGNHAMPKLQDTFLMPIIIFFQEIKKLRNPIRYFPFYMADETNFFSHWFFQYFMGTHSLISVDRSVAGKMRAKSVLKECREKVVGYSGILVNNIEGGRTQSAKSWIESPRGSRLGEPTRGAAIFSLENRMPIVPYWGRIVSVSCMRYTPQALFWKLLELIFKKEWRKIGFYEARPKASPGIVFWGLAELLLNPGVKAFIDINHPSGAIRPMAGGENSRQFTKRIAQIMLDVGDGQLDRIERSRKK